MWFRAYPVEPTGMGSGYARVSKVYYVVVIPQDSIWSTVESFLKEEVFEHLQSLNAIQPETKLQR